MAWQGTAPSNASVVVTPATTSITIEDWVTDGDTEDIVVPVWNSHNRTIVSVIRNGQNFAEDATAVYLASGRVSLWRLGAAPGAGTSDIVITFSGTANAAAVAGNLIDIGSVTDTFAIFNDTNSQPSAATLDPTENGGFAISVMLRAGATALVFDTTGSGTEHVDMAGATGQIGVASRAADAVTEVMDWGTITAGAFAHVGIAFGAPAAGGQTVALPTASTAVTAPSVTVRQNTALPVIAATVTAQPLSLLAGGIDVALPVPSVTVAPQFLQIRRIVGIPVATVITTAGGALSFTQSLPVSTTTVSALGLTPQASGEAVVALPSVTASVTAQTIIASAELSPVALPVASVFVGAQPLGVSGGAQALRKWMGRYRRTAPRKK